MTFMQFISILKGRRNLVLQIFFAIMVAVALLTFLRTKQYTATASVVVDSKGDPVASVMYPQQMMSTDIATQVDIITSARVARRVVQAVKLDQWPDMKEAWQEATGGRGDIVSWIAETRLSKRLLVTPTRESNVINISVSWPDAQFAAQLANSFAQAYIDTNIELKVDPAKHYVQWFSERSKQLRDDLEAKQKALAAAQSKNGIIAASDDRLDLEQNKLAELSTQLLQVQALHGDSQSRQRQASVDPESLPEVMASPVVASLKAELAKAEGNLSSVASELGKNHPDYQTAQAAVATLKQRIARESAVIAASLGSANSVNKGKESDLQAAFEAQKKRVIEMKGEHDRVAFLLNDVQVAQKNLDAVTQRLAQTSLESQSQQTNVSLLTPAVPPLKPSSPRVFFNLAIGVLFGLALGVGTALLRELADRRVREDQDMATLLGVPLLVTIPQIDVKDSSPKQLSFTSS